MSYWTFTDIFEEAGPAVTAFHGGFGLMNLQGIRKPSFFAYQFLHEMGNTELADADSCSWVCTNGKDIQVLFWNQQLPFADAPFFSDSLFRLNPPPPVTAPVSVRLSNIPNGKYEVSVYRTGYHHNDPFSAWLEMGSPANLSIPQTEALKKVASGDPETRQEVTIKDGRYEAEFGTRQNDIYFIKLVRV
jgi:xylan 1,4-beta-xylosidase